MKTFCVTFCTFSVFALLVLPIASAFRANFTPNTDELNRLFFYSPSSPVSRAINRIAPSVAEHVQVILGHVDFVEKKLLTSLTNGKLLKPDRSNRICTNIDQLLNESIFRSFGVRGIPDPTRDCITEVQAEGDSLSEGAPYSLNELYDAINERGIVLNQNMRRITSRFIDVRKNFTKPQTPHGFVYNRDTARCVLHSACGIRQGENWRLSTAIHNRPMSEGLPDFGRQIIVEYARNVKGRLGDNIKMRLEEFRSDEGPRATRRGSTYIVSGSGPGDPNCFVPEPIWKNRAMLDALIKVDKDIYLAEQAVKPSNIAIIVFPLGFTLVPISLFADLGGRSVLLYALVTDVLACIPLLLRGIELLSIHRSPDRAFTVRVTAPFNGSLSETASAEIWAAACEPPSRVRHIGLALVIIAVVFMVGGTLAELVSRKYAKEHKKHILQAMYYGKSDGAGRMLGVWAERDEKDLTTEDTPTAQDVD